REALRDADDRARAAATGRRIAERDIGFAGEDVDDLRLVDMVVAAGFTARRDASLDQLKPGAELAPDEAAVDRAGMRRGRILRQLGDVLDQGVEVSSAVVHRPVSIRGEGADNTSPWSGQRHR